VIATLPSQSAIRRQLELVDLSGDGQLDAVTFGGRIAATTRGRSTGPERRSTCSPPYRS
jgi:hypothetical protein